MSKKKNVREAALDILESIERNQAYSTLLLNRVIEENSFSRADTALLTEIVYGTTQRKLTLDFFLKPFLKKEPESWVRNLLRLSLYQMEYLDKIPDRAILYEAVEIAKRRGHRGISGMVNGVLRSVQRSGLPSLDEINDPLERLSVRTSHPLWLVKKWNGQYGYEKTEEICEANLIAPLQTARVNLFAASREEVLDKLQEEGAEAEASPLLPSAIRARKGNLAHTEAYKKGFLTIQDESSMAVGYALQVEPGMDVLDMCAAPGGKTTHIAEKLENKGSVTALDLHPHKVAMISGHADRLGLTTIEAKAMDSRKAGGEFAHASFDRVLVDAPCSGFGVLRRKPDIKYAKTEKDVAALAGVQLSLLSEAAKLVKKDGLLVYSTCTIDKDENTGTVKAFLAEHPGFAPEPLQLPEPLVALADGHMLQILPQDFSGDGFFISSFRKKVK